MTTWTDADLHRFGDAEEVRVAGHAPRRLAAHAGDRVGGARRRRPLHPIGERARRGMVPRRPGCATAGRSRPATRWLTSTSSTEVTPTTSDRRRLPAQVRPLPRPGQVHHQPGGALDDAETGSPPTRLGTTMQKMPTGHVDQGTGRDVHRRRVLRRHRQGRGTVADARQHRAVRPLRPHRVAYPRVRSDAARHRRHRPGPVPWRRGRRDRELPQESVFDDFPDASEIGLSCLQLSSIGGFQSAHIFVASLVNDCRELCSTRRDRADIHADH